MFADSLCDSSWANRSHRGWTTLISFVVQVVVVGSLLALPLFYTSSLPRPTWMAALVAPARQSAPLSPAPQHASNRTISNVASDGHIIAPAAIPQTIEHVSESSAPPEVDISGLRIPGGIGDNAARRGIWGSTGISPVPIVVQAAPAAHSLRVSVMMEGNLIRRVQPEYPTPAKIARVQGSVVLHAVISKQGTIENLQVVSGSPLLVRAAMDAVRQWRYKPYFLNNEPVEVDTQVTVNFVLSGG